MVANTAWSMVRAVIMVLIMLLVDLVPGHEALAVSSQAREDYFISTDTVIIGCTAGAAAGILAGSLPVFGALVAGTGLVTGVNLLINLTGLGCGVGAASGGVAILTAWGLDQYRSKAP